MIGWCDAITNETKLQEDTIDWRIQIDASDLLGITPELKTFLVDETGKSGEAQRKFLEDTIFGLEAMFANQKEDDEDDEYLTPNSSNEENLYASKSQILVARAHETA